MPVQINLQLCFVSLLAVIVCISGFLWGLSKIQKSNWKYLILMIGIAATFIQTILNLAYSQPDTSLSIKVSEIFGLQNESKAYLNDLKGIIIENTEVCKSNIAAMKTEYERVKKANEQANDENMQAKEENEALYDKMQMQYFDTGRFIECDINQMNKLNVGKEMSIEYDGKVVGEAKIYKSEQIDCEYEYYKGKIISHFNDLEWKVSY